MDACGELQPNDCKFEHWGQWSHCDAPCGKGTRERLREIAVYALGDGKGCEGATQEVSACELQACEAGLGLECLSQRGRGLQVERPELSAPKLQAAGPRSGTSGPSARPAVMAAPSGGSGTWRWRRSTAESSARRWRRAR